MRIRCTRHSDHESISSARADALPSPLSLLIVQSVLG